ncbi:MAG: hypothetical protein OQK24_08465 [Magnetovibrio sp.]|nr:hypothetical protein [Magnetovibrio sp.]
MSAKLKQKAVSGRRIGLEMARRDVEVVQRVAMNYLKKKNREERRGNLSEQKELKAVIVK